MKDESSMLTSLIEYLETNNSFEFIAREVPFCYGLRRADLVTCDKCSFETTAYEVKSDSDNLMKLEEQLKDYKEVFNYVYVVTTKKHLVNVRKVGLWFGIIIIDDNKKVSLLRKPRFRSKLNLSKIRSSMVKNIKSSENIHEAFSEWLKQRYVPLYEIFKKEKNKHSIDAHDLQILSLRDVNLKKI